MPCNCGESNCCCSGKCFCSEEFCMCIECFDLKEIPVNQFECEVITIPSSPAGSITTVNLDDQPDDEGNIHTGVGELCIEILDSPHQEPEADVISIVSDKAKQENELLDTVLEESIQDEGLDTVLDESIQDGLDTVLDESMHDNEGLDTVLDKTKENGLDIVLDKTKQEDERPNSRCTIILPEISSSSSESECEILLEKKGLKEETSEREEKPDTKQEDCIDRGPDNNNVVSDIAEEHNFPSCSNEYANSQNRRPEMSRNRHQFFKRGFRHTARSISPWPQRSYSFSGQHNQHRVPYNDQERVNRSQNIEIPSTFSRYFHRDTPSASVYDFDENEFLRSPPVPNRLCLPTFPRISTQTHSVATYRRDRHPSSTFPQISTQTHAAATYRRDRHSFQNQICPNPETTTTQSVDFGVSEDGMNCHQYTVSRSMFQTEFPNGYGMMNERNRLVINRQTRGGRRTGPHQNNRLQNNTAGSVEQPRQRRRRRRRRASRRMENGTIKKEVKNGCSIKKENGCIKKEIKKEGVRIKKEIKQERCFIKKEIKKEKP